MFGNQENTDKFKKRWIFEKDIYCAIENADALIILTEWAIYKTLDWEKISLKVKNPFWIFDTRSILCCKEVKKYGLNIWQLGNGDNS